MLKYLLLVFLVLTGCAIPAPKIPVIEQNVYLDQSFTPFEQLAVRHALQEWASATGTIKWTIMEWPRLDMKTFPVKNTCDKDLLIEKRSKNDAVIHRIEVAIGMRIRGWNSSAVDRCGLDTILIVADRLETFEELKVTVIHEIGHSLSLEHSADISVMHTSAPELVTGLTSYDIDAFCKIHPCRLKRDMGLTTIPTLSTDRALKRKVDSTSVK